VARRPAARGEIAGTNGPGRLRAGVALGLASAAIIAFQLVLMQLLAIAQWHHFAYMVISMALLGFGAAGTALVLWREFLDRHFVRALPLLFLACGLSMATTIRLAGLAGEFDAYLLFFDRGQLGRLLFSYAAFCLPFFFGGLAITLLFYRGVRRIGALYFANMAGSGAGALLVIGLLWLLPANRLAGLLALLPLASAWLLWTGSARHIPGTALGLVALLVALAAITHPPAPAASEYKDIHAALRLPGARLVHRSSSPYGLLEVVEAEAQRFAPGLSLRFRGEPPRRPVLFNNGEHFGTMLGRGLIGDSHVLDYSTRALPYALRRPASVLVLMAGTGEDVSHALSRGAARVGAVEPQRQVNGLLRQHHPEWIDELYLAPQVRVHGESVRSHLARQHERGFDLVVLPTLGAFGGTAGEHALQEQNHLTAQAFHAMWKVLGSEGMIVVTAWQDEPARVGLKLVATFRQLFDELGIERRVEHIVAVRGWGTTTFVLSKRPFKPDELGRARAFADSMAFDPLILGGLRPEERQRYNRIGDEGFFAAVDTLLLGDPAPLLATYPFDIRPATDDRPFFSHYMSWRGIPELRRSYGYRELPYLEIGFVLAVVTVVQILVAAIALIVLPLFRIGWAGTRRRWTLLYFSATGIGYMFFEIVLIQKLVLYLGQPVYAAAAVLATLLVCSGAGSLHSSRLAASHLRLLGTGLAIACLILVYATLLPTALGRTMSWALPLKGLAVFLSLAPPAYFMGMMFPIGLRRLAGSEQSHIPWACAIDSCLSVSATALATLIALEGGFAAVMLIAAAAYVIAALGGLRLGRNAHGTARAPAGIIRD
jgi:hypothetical protein